MLLSKDTERELQRLSVNGACETAGDVRPGRARARAR